jgi:hypothetical protein
MENIVWMCGLHHTTKLITGSISAMRVSLSLEQRIAVKSQLMRAGLLG